MVLCLFGSYGVGFLAMHLCMVVDPGISTRVVQRVVSGGKRDQEVGDAHVDGCRKCGVLMQEGTVHCDKCGVCIDGY